MFWDDILDAINKLADYWKKCFSVLCAEAQKSAKRYLRPENQRPRILFLDKRRKTYHCRNACATDHW